MEAHESVLTSYEYTSDSLYHFVGRARPNDDEANWKTLLAILESRQISSAPRTGGWAGVEITVNPGGHMRSEDFIVPRMVCFCDIPRSSLSIHCKKYGAFGVAFDRQLLLSYGARPVMYVPFHRDDWKGPHGNALLNDITVVYRQFMESIINELSQETGRERHMGSPPPGRDECLHAVDDILLRDFLAFVKPFNSELPIDDPNNYYMEREWRRLGNFVFTEAQVKAVCVAESYESRLEKDVPRLGDRIQVVRR